MGASGCSVASGVIPPAVTTPNSSWIAGRNRRPDLRGQHCVRPLDGREATTDLALCPVGPSGT
jgi:hypothetical protein